MNSLRRALPTSLVIAVIAVAALWAQTAPLPNRPDSLKFLAMGDNGTGGNEQYEVGQQMAALRASFPFELVIMLGDNMYGGQTPADYVRKFERPCSAPAAGVVFQASLGNHDRSEQVRYRCTT